MEPSFSQLLLDRFLVAVETNEIEPIILISKIDLMDDNELEKLLNVKKVYEKIGYPTLFVSTKHQDTIERVRPYLRQKTSVIAGQSGVGKSSILNSLDKSLQIETGKVSKSLGRGRHTTRHVELIPVSNGLVADTPGFSSLEFTDIEVEDLGTCFPEIHKVGETCRFRGCLHDKEPHCAVKVAVENEEICNHRYEHYLKFLEEIKSRKPRY